MTETNVFLTVLLAVFAVLGLITLARTARIVSQYEKGLVMRLGTYRATVGSGLTFLTPFIEDLIKVDVREKVINVDPQKVITKDNVTVTVDAVIFYRVIDPVKVVRTALQDAASVAGLLVTTEAMVAEKPKKGAPPPALSDAASMDF